MENTKGNRPYVGGEFRLVPTYKDTVGELVPQCTYFRQGKIPDTDKGEARVTVGESANTELRS